MPNHMEMWDERFVFVISALFALILCVVTTKRRESRITGRSPWFWYILLTVFVILATCILLNRYFDPATDRASRIPNVGNILSFMIGSTVGAVSARFFWNLYGESFEIKDVVISMLALLLMIVIYSWPVYHSNIEELLEHVGLSSLKTPLMELSFTEPSKLHTSFTSAVSPGGDGGAYAFPRPSDPLPGLVRLKQVVGEDPNDDLLKDARYIAFFNHLGDLQPGDARADRVTLAAHLFLRPAKTLARCLLAYVKIIPDSQLLVIDIKPVIQFFFSMHANAVVSLTGNGASDHPKNLESDFSLLVKLVGDIGDHVQQLLPPEDAKECPMEYFRDTIYWIPDLNGFSYLQPYVAIALADLLVAHGSPDEAIDVLAKWLYLWNCAHPDERGQRQEGCTFGPLPAAVGLPEWYGIRAEFELSALLYPQTGESNRIYRDFLRDHSGHFADFLEHHSRDFTDDTGQPATNFSIKEERQRCERLKTLTSGQMLTEKRFPPAVRRATWSRDETDRPTPSDGGQSRDDGPAPAVRTIMLRLLLQNENTLLRSELHFLNGTSWDEMEKLRDRAIDLTHFDIQCIGSSGDSEADKKFWEAQLEDYKITSGLLTLAIADQFASHTASADDRNRAVDLKKAGKQELRNGYAGLHSFCYEDRRRLERLPWWRRLFVVSPWEESCTLAIRQIHKLETDL
jgi:hypothetical protein